MGPNPSLSVEALIPVYNEAKTIRRCLDSLLNQRLKSGILERILVVSSGSTDGTDEMVRSMSQRDDRIILISEPERMGKAHAINTGLDLIPTGRICLLMSGDVAFKDENGLEEMLSPFRDPSVGLTSSRPVPVNAKDTLMGRVVHLLWDLRHRVSLVKPKTGEAIAFRKVFSSIPEDTLVDEASIEYEVERRGLKVVYCPRAEVVNRGPEDVKDFVNQRKRIYIGHKLLEWNCGYKGSTFNLWLLVKAMSSVVGEDPVNLFPLMVLVGLEVWARFLGRIDLALGRYDRHGRWEVITSSKGFS